MRERTGKSEANDKHDESRKPASQLRPNFTGRPRDHHSAISSTANQTIKCKPVRFGISKLLDTGRHSSRPEESAVIGRH